MYIDRLFPCAAIFFYVLLRKTVLYIVASICTFYTTMISVYKGCATDVRVKTRYSSPNT